MNQLQMKNPQMFQLINQARNNGADPQGMLKQMIGNGNAKNFQAVMQQAKSMGCPDVVLSQIQNMNKK